MTLDHVVVAGASIAGVRAAETLRREGYTGRLTIVGAEAHWPPVDRPPLSKQLLAGTWDVERSRLRTELDPAKDDGLELRLGRVATALDVAAHEITLDDGETLTFDGLVIATGCSPRTLPFAQGVGRVHVLRTLEDCIALRADLDRAATVAIVGAGFIGCEVAATARALGKEVAIVEALPLPLVRVMGERIGELVARLHRNNGVALHLGVGVAGLETDDAGGVRGIALADGTIVPADVVVIGVGVAPNTAWLDGSGLEVANGVVCDETLHAAEHVVAAGDVASWPHPLYRTRMRIEHWTNAAEQGEHAARSLLGPAGPYDGVPYFWSEQYATRFQMVGTTFPDAEVHLAEGDPEGEEGRGVFAFVRDDVVVGALCVNRPNRTLKWRTAVAERTAWPLVTPE